MNNYPTGVSDKDFEGADIWQQAIEQAREELSVTYRLVVETADGEVLYDDTFSSTESLESDGLRKADHAVDHAIEELAERLTEDDGEEY